MWGVRSTLYALREGHVRAPLSQQKSSVFPPRPPSPQAINNDRSLNEVEMRKFQCIYFQARYGVLSFCQVVVFLPNYEQTLFYSNILDSQNTFYLLLTFTLHLLLFDMLTLCLFQASVAGLRRTFSVIGCYMGVWCSECYWPNWNSVPVPLYHLQFSTGNFWLFVLAKSILGLY